MKGVGIAERERLQKGLKDLMGVMDVFIILSIVTVLLVFPESKLRLGILNMYSLLYVTCTSIKLLKWGIFIERQEMIL